MLTVVTGRSLLWRILPRSRNRPRVSIAMLTYNHRPFIEQAIESVLRQRTTFGWEVVIGDGYSIAGTRAILKSYEQRHPDRIRLLLHDRRLGPHENHLDGKNNVL